VRRRVPALVEVITERVTNIAMGPEIDRITEFEEVIDLPIEQSEARRAVPASETA